MTFDPTYKKSDIWSQDIWSQDIWSHLNKIVHLILAGRHSPHPGAAPCRHPQLGFPKILHTRTFFLKRYLSWACNFCNISRSSDLKVCSFVHLTVIMPPTHNAPVPMPPPSNSADLSHHEIVYSNIPYEIDSTKLRKYCSVTPSHQIRCIFYFQITSLFIFQINSIPKQNNCSIPAFPQHSGMVWRDGIGWCILQIPLLP